MAAVIELQVKADVQQAALGLDLMVKQLGRIAIASNIAATQVQKGLGNILSATSGFNNLNISDSFEESAKTINQSFDSIANHAEGVKNLFDSLSIGVNLDSLKSAFADGVKSVQQLETEIESLKTAIALSTDPIILQKFGQQLTKLESQLSNLRVVGSVKVEQISIPKLDVPLVRPQIDLSSLQSLRASFDSSIAPVDKLEAKIKGLETAIEKATDPVLVVAFRAEIDKLQTQLAGLKFDKIDIDPTSMRLLQSAFVDANKPLEQLQKEIVVLNDVLEKATASGSADVSRLSEQLGALKNQFSTLNATSLETAFQDGVKSAQQLQNEIFALGKSITVSTNPEDIVRFSKQIGVLQTQFNSLNFGGINVKIDTSSLSRLQSAFIDAIKPAEQLREEIDALEEAMHITSDPTALKVFGAQADKLKAQLNNIPFQGFEKGLVKIGQSAQKSGNSLQPLTRRSNEATMALTNLGRVAQDAPFGFIGIANNLNPLLESFQRLGKESGGLKNALKALGGSLMGAGGVGLALSAFQFIALGGVDAVAKMFGGVDAAKARAEKLKKAAEEAKQAAQDFVDGLDDITRSRIQGTQQAQEELGKLATLYTATQNQNIALKDRKKAVDELQKLYPAYFKNISDETILAGGAKSAYDRLTTSIIAASKARVLQKTLDDLTAQGVAVDEQGKQAADDLVKAKKEQAKVQAQINGQGNALRAKESTAVINQDNLNKAINATNAAQNSLNDKAKQYADIQDRIKNLGDEIQKNIVTNGIETVVPTPKLDTKKENSGKLNFFDKFFDLTPPKGQVEKQLDEMFQAAHDYAEKNVKLFQVKVGDKFIDLSELQKVGDRKEVVELGKKVWTSIQEGLVKFKPPKIDLATEVNLVPAVNDTNFTGAIDSFISSMQKSIQGKQEITEFLNIPDRSQVLDTYITKFQQIGAALPSLIQIEDVMGNLQNVDLNTAKGSELTFNYDSFVKALKSAFSKASTEVNAFKEQFQSTVQNMVTNSFVAIGDAIGNLISGSGIGDAFSSLFQFIGGAIQDLGKQMIALAPIFAALKLAIRKLDPSGGLLSGIALVALGGVIKNIRPKGFASGGLVFGPTMGLVGEGSGTSRSNPEVIAPLDKLKNFIGGNNSAPSERLVAQVSGQNIDLVLQRFYGKQRRNG